MTENAHATVTPSGIEIDLSQVPAPVAAAIDTLDAERAPQIAVDLGLTLDEYETVKATLGGREASLTELYVYSLMWSEHCSYKHSKRQLRRFPSEGPDVMQGPGENAGVIRVGDGWAVAFKMESHNHPSAIEPFQGAATGVGGIVRDIFTMGARPIASLDSLRFGMLDKARQRYLFEGSVEGIGSYGNCLGIPTVGGEVYFDEAYEGNCLINAMCVGVMREEDLTRAVGSGPGNPVVLLGSTTGRDGIGGASTLASQEFDEAAENKRPAVQVGDPFTEKLLIEVCLELLQRGGFVALGDLGAAGLTSSASEMASRGGVGIDLDVRKVPAREDGMRPFEVMVSESQERMLGVVTPENLDDVMATCERWGVRCAVIGSITDTGRFVVHDGDLPAGQDIVADMPAALLADAAPVYDPAFRRPAYLDEVAEYNPYHLLLESTVVDLSAVLLTMLASPNVCSRRWIWEQYDHQVQSGTVVLPGADAAVVRVGLPGRGAVTNRGIALASDCNGRYCYLDPYVGAQIALAEASRNVSCVGARPAAITDCLNFGNPEKPEVFYMFKEAVRGLSDACKVMGVPVVSGNVSLYNESFSQPIHPTPVVGMVGIIDSLDEVCTASFKQAGDTIILVGETHDELGGSEYLKHVHDVTAGTIPRLDLGLEMDVQSTVRDAVRMHLLSSAHDCSDGGLAVALAESCISGHLGCEVALDDGLEPVASLFSETQSRILVSLSDDKVEEFEKLVGKHAVPWSVLGTVGGERIGIEGKVDVGLGEAAHIFDVTLEDLVNQVD